MYDNRNNVDIEMLLYPVFVSSIWIRYVYPVFVSGICIRYLKEYN